MVELREITRDNLEEVLQLKVSVSQRDFVSTNAHSLSQAYVYKNTAFPFAIYADKVMVGLVMLGYYELENQYTLWKFMIDEKHQNKGIGREALKLSIDWLAKKFNTKEVFTGVALENTVAENLYDSFGFRKTGKCDGYQLEMKLTIVGG